MEILDLARESGLFITLDGRIGREEYRSVHGSLNALERFVDALLTHHAIRARDERAPVSPTAAD